MASNVASGDGHQTERRRITMMGHIHWEVLPWMFAHLMFSWQPCRINDDNYHGRIVQTREHGACKVRVGVRGQNRGKKRQKENGLGHSSQNPAPMASCRTSPHVESCSPNPDPLFARSYPDLLDGSGKLLRSESLKLPLFKYGDLSSKYPSWIQPWNRILERPLSI